MSVQTEIDRISGNVAAAYTAAEELGADLPAELNSDNLPGTIKTIQAGSETAEHTWDQMPALVKSFLENVTYDPNDYSVSEIANYAPATADRNNTYPIGKTIEIAGGVLDRKGYEIAVSSGSTTLYNDIPNQHTEYVARNNGTVSQAGTLKPTGTLRQIKCATTNVRDLGGWACDGGTVKYGKLFRGGEIAESDIDIFVNQLGIRHELNLRGLSESGGKTESILGSEIGYTCPEKYVWHTISDKTTWKEILRCVFDCVAENKPLFFHCAAGADRTGTVACMIEAILGMSQSDIDKDYELTCFMTGTSSDTQARRRNESDWQGQISAITALTVGTTFRDKVLNWVASMGFMADEINAFRYAMIDGTPDTITLDIEEYTVTNTLSNVTTDNEATEVTQYQPYKANISVENGYAIKNVTITMGGADVTREVFSGTKTNFCHHVTTNLVNCTKNNKKTGVIDGQGYGAIFTANDGYTLDGAVVSITMGGNDMSQYYSNGVVAIPNVTGDLVINIEAVESAAEETYVNKMVVQSSNLNKRISGTTIAGAAGNGVFICDPVEADITKECPVIFKNFASSMGAKLSGANYGNSKVALLDSNKACLAVWYIGSLTREDTWGCPISGTDCVGDLSSILESAPTAGTKPSASDVKYVIFSPAISSSAITMDSLAGLEIQMLE